MAYGNWGAWVFKDGEHMPNWEDQSPYREEDTVAGYMQAFSRSETGLNPHHAVLGGREMRLCGYKNYPVLFYRLQQVDLDPYVIEEPTDDWSYDKIYQGEIDGYRFRAEQFNDNMIDLLLIEPDGTQWVSRCGYCYGAGHHETPSNDARIKWVA